MGRNVEIKARIRDWDKAHTVARRLSGGEARVLEQVDTFFRVPSGRLKLRELGPAQGELILYDRPDTAMAKTSDYVIARTQDPEALVGILKRVLGDAGVVRKTRHLYIVGQTRIHLNDVAGLGRFLEFEVVLGPGQEAVEGERIATELQGEFGIAPGDLLEGAYVDMLGDH